MGNKVRTYRVQVSYLNATIGTATVEQYFDFANNDISYTDYGYKQFLIRMVLKPSFLFCIKCLKQ